jgi:lysozyme
MTQTSRWKKAALSGAGAAVLLAGLTTYFEGDRSVPYQDVGGVWTNCEGNTHNVDPQYVMTPQECKVIDGENRLTALQALQVYVKVPLTEGEKAAYADFIFNMGSARFQHSTLLTYLNAGQHKKACAQLLRWTYAGGKQLSGLVTRRNAEYDECTALPFKE